MRLNRYIAKYSELSRRKADTLIEDSRVVVNRKPAHVGMDVLENDVVLIDGKKIVPVERKTVTIMLNKPVGFVSSRDGQGSPCVYDLLQKSMQNMNIAGRLDKDSSGLVILTNDGQLLQELTHPSYNKEKVYTVKTKKVLTKDDVKRFELGVYIGDERLSMLQVQCQPIKKECKVTMQEGRNRQIRRSFESIGHEIVALHRTQLGPYKLGDLKPEQFREIHIK